MEQILNGEGKTFPMKHFSILNIRLLKPASCSERIAIRVFIKYDWFMMINHDDQCTNKQMLGAQPLTREAGKT